MSGLTDTSTLCDLLLWKETVIADLGRWAGRNAERLAASAQIHRLEWACPALSPLSWMRAQASDQKLYWSDRASLKEVAGIGCAQRVTAASITELAALMAALQEALPQEPPLARFYGGMAFDPHRALQGDWPHFEPIEFVLPRFELIRGDQETRFCVNLSARDTALTIDQLITAVGGLSFDAHGAKESWPGGHRRVDCPNATQWQTQVDELLAGIAADEYQKIVLARRCRLSFDAPIPAAQLLERLKAHTPTCFHFYFQKAPDVVFLGASPERLFKREGRRIWSEAIAGTRPRCADHQADCQQAQELLTSTKEAHEHRLVVDHIQSQLSPLCASLYVDAQMQLLRLQAGQHLLTRCEGTLKEGVEDARLLSHLAPTPAVAGHPVQTALDALSRLEAFQRGWYAGPLGYIGAQASEFVVAIRSGLVRGEVLDLYAGAGIVKGSQASSEWDEIENKLSSFLDIVT